MSRALLVCLLVLPLAGCKKPVGPVGPVPTLDAPPAIAAKPAEAPEDRLAANFRRVNFPFDSAELTPAARAALAENARILANHPALRVEVQGHCDERGTTEYNLALGDRRAQAVRNYLAGEGVAAGRFAAVSYGEERPLASGVGEVVWAENRRAEFRILSERDGAVLGTTD